VLVVVKTWRPLFRHFFYSYTKALGFYSKSVPCCRENKAGKILSPTSTPIFNSCSTSAFAVTACRTLNRHLQQLCSFVSSIWLAFVYTASSYSQKFVRLASRVVGKDQGIDDCEEEDFQRHEQRQKETYDTEAGLPTYQEHNDKMARKGSGGGGGVDIRYITSPSCAQSEHH
jgi:hypothetical protein